MTDPAAQMHRRALADFGLRGKNKHASVVEWLFRINAGNLLADVKGIDYIPPQCREDVQKIPLEPVCDLFCDNIMLYTLVPKEALVKSACGKNLLNAIDTSYYNKRVREALKTAGIIATMVKLKAPGPLACQSAKMDKLRDTLHAPYSKAKREHAIATAKAKYNVTIDKVDELYVVDIKCDLQDTPFDELVERLEATLADCGNTGIYLHDFDITMDCAGTMDKKELTQYLLRRGYGKQNEKEIRGHGIIMDNDGLVGEDCLTIITDTDLEAGSCVTLRAKLYNKFVCQMCSPGVTHGFGNHIADYLEPPVETLQHNFYDPRVRERGITRLEITIYAYTLLKSAEYRAIIQETLCEEIADKPLFYAVPLALQYKQITDRVLGNMVVFDNTNRIAYAGFWVNTLTHKITGLVKKSVRAKKQRLRDEEDKDDNEEDKDEATFERTKMHVVSQCSFANKPCHVVDVEFIGDDVSVRSHTEIKRAVGAYTIACPALFHKTKKPIDLSKTAFAGSSIVFGIPTNTINNKSVPRFAMELCPELHKEPTIITEKEWKKMQETEMLAFAHNEAKRGNIEYMQAHKAEEEKLAEYNRLRAEMEAVALLRQERVSRVIKGFSGTAVALLSMPNGDYDVVAIKRTSRQDLWILQDRQGHTFWCPKYIRVCLERPHAELGGKTPFDALPFNPEANCIGFDDFQQALVTFTKAGECTFNSKPYPAIRKTCVYGSSGLIAMSEQEKPEHKRQELAKKVADAKADAAQTALVVNTALAATKTTNAKTLNELAEGTRLVVNEICWIEYRKKRRYLFQAKGADDVYISNHFLEKAMEDMDLATRKAPIILACVRLRTTPTKKKEMDVEIA